MPKEKKPRSTRRKIVIGAAAAVIAAIVVGVSVFYCTFFPNLLAKKISPADISAGEMSVSGESNVLVAYFSIANNRTYSEGEVDAVASASLKIRDGKAYGHAELYAMAAQEATGGDLFPIKTADLYPESYGGAFNRHHSETGTAYRPELAEHLEGPQQVFVPCLREEADMAIPCPRGRPAAEIVIQPRVFQGLPAHDALTGDERRIFPGRYKHTPTGFHNGHKPQWQGRSPAGARSQARRRGCKTF